MAVDGKTLTKHPGRNQDYEAGMRARRAAQRHNRDVSVLGLMTKVRVPRQPNKYIPHQGKKEMSRHGK